MEIYTAIIIGYVIRTFQKEIISGIKELGEWMTNTGKYAKGKGGSGGAT